MGNTFVKHENKLYSSPKSFNFKKPKNDSKHGNHSNKHRRMKELQDFLIICDEFENALKTIEVHQSSRHSFHQRLLGLYKVLAEKISTLEKSTSTRCAYSGKSLNQLSNLSLFKEFFKRVNCPFCDEKQADKFYLIKHLDESCLQFKTKSFNMERDLQYSSFQILAKNWFKCNICPNIIARNLQGYLIHLNCSIHKNLKSASVSKSYTDSLFCSVCKFLVPDNFTELNMHLNHEQHNERKQKFVYEKFFLRKKISGIYYKYGEYYCLLCSKKINKLNNLQGFMSHLTGNEHKQNLEKHLIETTKVYCEICEKELNTFEIWDHFQSLEHKSKILKNRRTPYYLLCVYCSSVFSDLKELSNHMNGGCKEMEILRRDRVISGPEAPDKSAEMEKGISEDSEVKEGHCLFIDVSDDLDISDLKNYFENFGRVISLHNLTNNKFIIVFSEKDVVNKLLSFKNSLIVNGKKLAVSEFMSEKVENQSNQSEIESDEENDTSDDDSLSDIDEMKNLFQEVGSHLLKQIETIDSPDDDEILLISQMVLKATVTFSGFRDCQLRLPNETHLNLHCQFNSENFEYSEGYLRNRALDHDSKESLSLASKIALELIDKSPFWEQADRIPTSSSYVKCIHKRTNKLCIITFSPSDKFLTEALRACLKENDFIRAFLLMLKLWLSSQKTFLSDFEYPLIAVILYFLTNKSLVRPFFTYQSPIYPRILDALKLDDLTTIKPVKNIAEEDVSKLFQMFLEFLSTFDFEKYAICFPFRVPVPKTILSSTLNVKEYASDSICIMNFSCTWNYTSHVQKTELRSFQNLVIEALKEC